MKILVVEDNAINMKYFATLLERGGYQVLQATDAQEGLRIAREELPPLIIMDIQLPGMDGMTAIKLLKGDDQTKCIKIFAVTALAMKDEEEKIRASGCDAYITKPVDYKSFLEQISMVAAENSAL